MSVIQMKNARDDQISKDKIVSEQPPVKTAFVEPKLVQHGKVNEITKFWGHKNFGSFYH